MVGSTNMATELSLKLLIDTKSNRVLFAEAGKDVVDFLFSILSIPVGAITNLLTSEEMVGSIGSIYKSIQNLDQTYFQADQNKNILLNPTTRSPSSNSTFLLTGAGSVAAKYYRCATASLETHSSPFGATSFASSPSLGSTSFTSSSSPVFGFYSCPAFGSTSCASNACMMRITDVYGTRCPSCGKEMKVEVHYVEPNSEEVANNKVGVGFVKDVVTYTVADDLTVTPMSAIWSITMLNKFNVTDVGSLEERTVKLGKEEGLALLKSSLQSKTVLTDVFLGMNYCRTETW